MSEPKPDAEEHGIALDYELDEPPQKVWRALNTPALRDVWLPDSALADPDAIPVTPGEALQYRLRESTPPFLESLVTFRIAPNGTGGTRLQIVHAPPDLRFARRVQAATNSNHPPLMRAA